MQRREINELGRELSMKIGVFSLEQEETEITGEAVMKWNRTGKGLHGPVDPPSPRLRRTSRSSQIEGAKHAALIWNDI